MSTLALASAQGLLQAARIPVGQQRPAVAMSELVQRAQGGDDEAFGALYRAHVGRVHALCLRLAGDAQAAGELTQDVFVRAWEALPSFRGESAFGSWLHRLAMNVFLGKRRATGRRERRIFTTDEPALLERPGAEREPPGVRLDLEQAIATLPAGARAVFVLHDVEGYQHGEIARMTGIAEGTSKAQLFRARRLLREALAR
ncbi:MAG TPA: RNA polymerase sigma factor [Gemmatimonadales bacterium]|nr:RNA polymerase sigma factor [Gemmatimonadales bacterium]